MSPEKPKATRSDPVDDPAPNPEIEAFFQRLPGNLHWPPPTEAAIAAAVEAIQRIAAPDNSGSGQSTAPDFQTICSSCGQALAEGVSFCANCGASTSNASGPHVETKVQVDAPVSAGNAVRAQHHIHHHYHHFANSAGNSPSTTQASPGSPRGSASAGTAPGGRAEISARQMAQDWAQACNTKHLDDLVELYSADATLMRPNVLPVRTTAAIREFLFAAIEAGLGEVEMSSLRTELFGEIALDLGRCKMLVPVAMGKRREERGKYLLVLARQPSGQWKIVADCWSTDLVVSAAPTEIPRRPADSSARKPR